MSAFLEVGDQHLAGLQVAGDRVQRPRLRPAVLARDQVLVDADELGTAGVQQCPPLPAVPCLVVVGVPVGGADDDRFRPLEVGGVGDVRVPFADVGEEGVSAAERDLGGCCLWRDAARPPGAERLLLE